MGKPQNKRKNKNAKKLKNTCNHSHKTPESSHNFKKKKNHRGIKNERSHLSGHIRSPSSYRFLSPLSNTSLKGSFHNPLLSKLISDTYIEDMRPSKELRFSDAPKKSRFSPYVNNASDISRFVNSKSGRGKRGLFEENDEDDEDHESTIQEISHYLRKSLNKFHDEMVFGLHRSLKKLKNNSLISITSKNKTKKNLISRSSLDSLKLNSDLKTILKNNSTIERRKPDFRDAQVYQVGNNKFVKSLKNTLLSKGGQTSNWVESSLEDDLVSRMDTKMTMTTAKKSSTNSKPDYYKGFENSTSTSTIIYPPSRDTEYFLRMKQGKKSKRKKSRSDDLVEQAKVVLEMQDRIGELQKTQCELMKHHCCFTNLYNRCSYPCYY